MVKLVKSPPSNAGDASLIPGWETNIPHALEQPSLSAATREARKTQHSQPGGRGAGKSVKLSLPALPTLPRDSAAIFPALILEQRAVVVLLSFHPSLLAYLLF